MKKSIYTLGLFLLLPLQRPPDIRSAERPTISPDYGKVPLYFVPNKGQADERALFYAKTSRYTLWMTKNGLVFDSTANSKRDVSKLIFLNANKNPEVLSLKPTEHLANYFIGDDPAKWKKDISTSLAILYKNLYPGIDLKVYGIEKQIEYDWVVKPGAHVEDIRFEYKDIKSTEIDEEGNLLVETRFGELVHKKPLSFQMKKPVEVQFKEIGQNTWGFYAADYDKSLELIIDPVVLMHSTYLGGESQDIGRGVAVDGTGAAYVVGETTSLDFPLKNPIQAENKGYEDVFITKFKPGGSSLVYSTYIGGSERGNGGTDMAWDIAVDGNGCAYVIGSTNSLDFPLKNPLQRALRGENDAFLFKLTSAGNNLVFSTYLGGSSTDSGNGIAVDTSGVYVTGGTSSPDFRLKNPFQKTARGKSDAYVAKFAPDGNSRIYSTYLGGDDSESGIKIAVDSAGSAYVTGNTFSSDFPLKNPFQKTLKGRSDVFVTKLSPSGKSLSYSSYLGGSGEWEWSKSIAVDGSGAAYVTGETTSLDFPLKNPFQKKRRYKYGDVFVTKISPAGTALVYSTYLGGTKENYGGGIAVDDMGCAYVAGYTRSSNFPVKNPFQGKLKAMRFNAFITKFMPDGETLAFSTYLGGSLSDEAHGIVIDGNGAAYITGTTCSSDFPIKHPFRSQNSGAFNVFLTKLMENPPTPLIQVISPGGGERWKVGSRQTIQWKTAGKVGNVWISYSTDGGTAFRTIIRSTKNAGSYAWVVPDSPSARCLIRIREASDGIPYDLSDGVFSIINE